MKQLREFGRQAVILVAVAIGLAGASAIFLPKRQAAEPPNPSGQCAVEVARTLSDDVLPPDPELEARASMIQQMRLRNSPVQEIDLALADLQHERDRRQIVHKQDYCIRWAKCFPQRPYQQVFDECYRSLQ